MNFKTIAAFASVLALGVACGDKDDSGADGSGGATCSGYVSALEECYAEAGVDLADYGIDTATYCDTYDSGDLGDYWGCLTDSINAGDCTTAEGITAISEDAATCTP